MYHSKLLLQRSVDILFDKSQLKNPMKNKTRVLKSLTYILKGLLRLNLLGKRVDLSARSVIVVEPSLKLFQCGIPKLMILKKMYGIP
jgi:DNA-directed RNA polymerase subunit beta'